MSVFAEIPLIRISRAQRNARLNWELGPVLLDGEDPGVAVAQLSVFHNKDRKQFVASVTRVDVTESVGMLVERYAPFGGTRVQITPIPVARFSQKAFDEAIDTALAELRSRADDPAVAAVADPTSPA